jgi:hypothetical protein
VVRGRQTQSDRQSQTDSPTDRVRQTEADRYRQTVRQTEPGRDRKADRQSQTDRVRQTEAERERLTVRQSRTDRVWPSQAGSPCPLIVDEPAPARGLKRHFSTLPTFPDF